ncbi:alpha-amylase family glycosyl hydrolase [Mollicutes bacterium LVI A0039]|nr:alpha-amylase family glycosyl hydrolase [Mollicutes bacterium LVI A0039]
MNNKVIYQIYPKSFKDTNNDGIGDLNGIIEKIDYIKNLGADYIWLTPILKSPQHDNGYDISDFYDVDPIFGTIADYKTLLNKCKESNIKVIFDLVLNHISTDHEWFRRAINGEEYYQDFFVWTDQPNSLMSAFGSSAWTYNQQVGKYYLHLFDETQVDLNWHNPEVRKKLYEMINFWIDAGVEGFRLDVIDLIAKEPEKMITSNGPNLLNYLSELSNATFSNKFLTVGECWNFQPQDTVKITGDEGLTQVFHFSHLNWIYPKWNLSRISLSELSQVMNNWQTEPKVIEALTLNNHDLPRLQSYWFGPSANHKENYLKSTLLFAMNILSQGNTYIYQGEEIGMENAYNFKLDDYNDIESLNKIQELIASGLSNEEILRIMHTVSRDNARTPMKWDSSQNYGFSNSKPWLELNECNQNVEEDLASQYSVYKKYQEMINWKKNNYNDLTFDYKAEAVDKVLMIKSGKFIAKLNFGTKPIISEINEVKPLLTNKVDNFSVLQPYEFIIFKR